MSRSGARVYRLGVPVPSVPSDEPELMARVAQGDAAAFEWLYDSYSADAFGVSLRILRDRALAEDATQETFIAAWRNAASYRPEVASLRTWVVMIARRRSIDILRRRRPERLERLADETMRPAAADVWSDVVRILDGDAMAAILARLPVEQREVLNLAFLRGLTHVQIASETATPLGTVKGRARLALQAARRMALASL
jgi:RNA polymerase sigma-70 factor, ECF subfamily